MRPLLMVYDNPDPSSVPQDVRVIFKNGDGGLEFDNWGSDCKLVDVVRVCRWMW